MREYDLIAEWYASERGQRDDDTGVPEALALSNSIRPGGCVLDIGCGNGVPITKALLNVGLKVVGLDSSANMLARFQANCATTSAVRALVQACPFADEMFDGAIAWGVMFHLPPAHEIEAIASVARVLKPGASFLFTAGDADDESGDHIGTMNGVEFHYYSFSLDGYRRILAAHDLTLVDCHTDKGDNRYYLARKSA